MPKDLAALLAEEGAAPADAVERAVARQREAGGALDTALLEVGAITEEALVPILARAAGLPAAPDTAWTAADARARRVFPSRVAERHGLAPFALEGRELSLVATHPVDVGLLDEISFMLSLHLTAHVGPEWRVRELIHRLYGSPLPARLAALAARSGVTADLAALPPPEEPPPAPPPTGFERDESEPLEPLAAALEQALDSFDVSVEEEPPAEEPREPEGAAEPAPPRPPPDRTAPPRWKLDDARVALAAAEDRDDVVLAALRYARDFFEFAGLFAVTRDAIAGHDALGPDDARERIRAVAIYANDPGMFKTVLETRSPYLGPVPRDVAANEAVLAGLGRKPPRTALVAPVVLRDRPVCILYADNGEAPVSARRLGDLLLFLSTIGSAFERIIRDRKKRPRRRAPAADAAPAAAGGALPAEAPEGGREPEEAPAAAQEPAPERTEAASAPDAGASREGDGAAADAIAAALASVDVVVDAEGPAPGETAPPPASPPEPEPGPGQEEAEEGPNPAAEAARAGDAEDPAAPAEPAAAPSADSLEDIERRFFGLDGPSWSQPAAPAPTAEEPPVEEAAEKSEPAAGAEPAERPADAPSAEEPAGPEQPEERAAPPGPQEPGGAPAGPGSPQPAAAGETAPPPSPPAEGTPPPEQAAPPPEAPPPAQTPAPARPESPTALADRALDADPSVASAACDSLAARRRDPALRPTAEKLRRALLSGIASRATRAAKALGALRDVEAIPMLVQVLETSEPEPAQAAADALASITLQRLGTDARKWLGWWKKNRGRGRAEWLFSGLTSAERETRVAAEAELRQAGEAPVEYSPDMSPPDRERAARAWAGWLARSGHVV